MEANCESSISFTFNRVTFTIRRTVNTSNSGLFGLKLYIQCWSVVNWIRRVRLTEWKDELETKYLLNWSELNEFLVYLQIFCPNYRHQVRWYLWSPVLRTQAQGNPWWHHWLNIQYPLQAFWLCHQYNAHCAVLNLQCSLCSSQSAVLIVLFSICRAHCAVLNLQCSLYCSQSAVLIVKFSMFRAQSAVLCRAQSAVLIE